MASGISQDFINQNVTALSEIYPRLDKEIIYPVVQQCHFDFIRASKILAEMSSFGAASQETNQNSHHRNDSNFTGDYLGPNNSYARIINFIKSGYKVLIFMRGLPASGKTTLAKKLLHESLGKVDENELIINTDQYLPLYVNRDLDSPYQWSQKNCFSNMKEGISPIIIDDIHIDIQKLKPYCVMAVKFGYIIEIAVPMTNWALNPKMISAQTNLRYSEQKLKEMLKSYEQNITAKDLFKEFNLEYTDQIPQYRTYPPLEVTSQHARDRNVLMSNLVSPKPLQNDYSVQKGNTWLPPQGKYGPLEKKKTQLPIEYVHKFEVRRETFPSKKPVTDVKVQPVNKKSQPVDIKTQPVNIKNETKLEGPSAEDLIDFINEHKQAAKQEEPIKSIDAEDLAKQIQENTELMTKMLELLNQQPTRINQEPLPDGKNLTKPAMEVPLEVTEPANIEDQKLVQNEVNKVDAPPISLSLTNSQILKKENKMLWGLLNRDKAPKLEEKKSEITSTSRPITGSIKKIDNISDDVEILSSAMEKLRFDKPNKEDSQNNFKIIENKTSPNTEQPLKSPVINEKSSAPKLPPKPIRFETRNRNVRTYMSPDDFKQMRRTFDKDSWKASTNIPKKLNDDDSPKNIILDNEYMVGKNIPLPKLQDEEIKILKELKKEFPNISALNMMIAYQKCDTNLLRTTDMLRNSQKHSESTNIVENSKRKGQVVEEIGKKELQKGEDKQLKQEIVPELSKQVEKIGKTHYSENAPQLEKVETDAVSRQQNLTDLEKKIVPTKSETIKTSIDTCDGNSDSGNESGKVVEELVSLYLGNDLARQLESMFGKLVEEGENFAPVVQSPMSLARQLHALYLESICLQRDNQSENISSQLKENVSGNSANEDPAMSIFQKDSDQSKTITPDSLAMKLAQQKLHSVFPRIDPKVLDSVLATRDNNYKVTVKTIMNRMGTAPLSTTNSDSPWEPPISDTILAEMRKQHQIVNDVPDEVESFVKSATYRYETKKHMEKREELLQLAQKQQRNRSNEIAKFYRSLSQIELQKAEVSNKLAIQCFAKENAENLEKCNTLNLHFFYVKDAIVALDAFIDNQIINLRTANQSNKQYYVVTGRGKINEGEMFELKSAVVERLKYRKIRVSSINPGMLQILVEKNLPTSSDLKKFEPKTKSTNV